MPATNPVLDVPEVDRTIEQWSSFSKESLILLCDPIVTNPSGSKKKLAKILYDFYNPEEPAVENTTQQPLPSPPPAAVPTYADDDEFELLINGNLPLLDYGTDNDERDAQGGAVQGDGSPNTQGGKADDGDEYNAQGGTPQHYPDDGEVKFTRELFDDRPPSRSPTRSPSRSPSGSSRSSSLSLSPRHRTTHRSQESSQTTVPWSNEADFPAKVQQQQLPAKVQQQQPPAKVQQQQQQVRSLPLRSSRQQTLQSSKNNKDDVNQKKTANNTSLHPHTQRSIEALMMTVNSLQAQQNETRVRQDLLSKKLTNSKLQPSPPAAPSSAVGRTNSKRPQTVTPPTAPPAKKSRSSQLKSVIINPADSSRNQTQGKNKLSTGSSSRSAGQQQQQGIVTTHLSQPHAYERPPIKRELLKDIRNGKCVDFNRLLPPTATSHSVDEPEGLELRYDRRKKYPVLTSPSPSAKITDFPEWMEAWNVFMQARLHFYPDEAPQLFAYQKTISRLARSYEFFAVMNYDKNLRSLIANNESTPPSQRTAAWDRYNEELDRRYLRDNMALPVTCFHCKKKGHFSNNCTLPL